MMDAATGNEQRPAVEDGMPERVAVVVLMNEDGNEQRSRRHEPADPGMAASNHEALKTPSQ